MYPEYFTCGELHAINHELYSSASKPIGLHHDFILESLQGAFFSLELPSHQLFNLLLGPYER